MFPMKSGFSGGVCLFVLTLFFFHQAAHSLPVFEKDVLIQQADAKAKGAVAEALNSLNAGRLDEAIAKAGSLMKTHPGQAAPANEIIGAAWALKGDNAKGLEYLNRAVAANPRQSTAITKIGDIHFAEKRFKEAKAQFRKAIDADPALRLPYQRLGLILAQEGRTEAAVSAFEKGLEGADPRYVGIKLDLARLYVATGEYGKCRDMLEALRKLNINSMEIHLHLGAAYQGLGDQAGALKQYEAATKLMEDPTEGKITLAAAHRDMGRLDKAAEILKTALGANPDSRKLKLHLALTYGKLGRTAEALALVGEVDKSGSLPDARIVEAEIHAGAKDWKKTIAIYQGLLAAEKNLDLYKKLIAAYQLSARPDSAEKIARLLPKIFPGDPAAHYEAVMALGYVKKIDEALKAAKEAMVLFPGEPSFRKVRSALFLKKGDRKAAVAEAEAFAAAEPDNTGSQIYLASLYQDAGEYDKAAAGYRRILAASPDQAAVRNNLALIFQEQGESDSALVHSRKAAALAPGNGNIQDTYGWILFKRKEAKEALAVLEKAHALVPRNPAVSYHYCEALVAVGRKEAARPLLEEILKDPSFRDGAPNQGGSKEAKLAQDLLRRIGGLALKVE
jgi:cellulose synthase operon protein C